VCDALPDHPIPLNIGCFIIGITGALLASNQYSLYQETACQQAKKELLARSNYQLNTILLNELQVVNKTEIERLIASGVNIAAFHLPASQGGSLEEVQSVVSNVFGLFKAANQLTSYQISQIDNYITTGTDAFNSGEYAQCYYTYV